MLILPITAYAFNFEVQLIPVQCYFVGKDQSGNRAKKSAWLALTLALAFYLIIIGQFFVVNSYVKDQVCENCSFYMVVFRQYDKPYACLVITLIIVKCVF